MAELTSTSSSPRLPPASVVTPGNHDGVHLGHRALLARARAHAQRATPSMRVVAMTFDPHPTQFVAPHRAPPLLTAPDRRVELLRQVGADCVHVQAFDAKFAALSPEKFLQDVLVAGIGARVVVVGSDFRFGAGRAGNVTTLTEMGQAVGVEVDVVAPVQAEGVPISSSRIRTALSLGDVASANAMLARVHEVTGQVVHGDARGRQLGFPTANLSDCDVILPGDGVYAVVARALDGPTDAVLRGVANLGLRPSVAAGRSVEVHLLDFEGDLYGRALRVGFVARLRDERRFEDVAALCAQITRDVEDGRAALAAADPSLWQWI